MTWHSQEARLALLELLAKGSLRCRHSQAGAWEHLASLPWTQRTRRRDELALNEAHRHVVLALLSRVWPSWQEAFEALQARGLPPTPEGWAELEDARRAAALPVLPDQLNRRTVAALLAPHSKARLTKRRLAALGSVMATCDGTARLRVPDGTEAHTAAATLSLAPIAALLGEVAVPQRALQSGLTLSGPFEALLFIENLGVFRDLPLQSGWLYAHVPGWETSTARLLLAQLAQVPVAHFGDLDPNGVRIFQHLRQERPDLRWFVPPFWADYLLTHARPTTWPAHLDLTEAPGLIKELAHQGLWLEQEPLAVDPRTLPALQATIEHSSI